MGWIRQKLGKNQQQKKTNIAQRIVRIIGSSVVTDTVQPCIEKQTAVAFRRLRRVGGAIALLLVRLGLELMPDCHMAKRA